MILTVSPGTTFTLSCKVRPLATAPVAQPYAHPRSRTTRARFPCRACADRGRSGVPGGVRGSPAALSDPLQPLVEPGAGAGPAVAAGAGVQRDRGCLSACFRPVQLAPARADRGHFPAPGGGAGGGLLRHRRSLLPDPEPAPVARRGGARRARDRLRGAHLAPGVRARRRPGDLQAARTGLRRRRCCRLGRQPAPLGGPLRLFSSRPMDLLASLAVLAVSLPLMLLTLIAIKIEDGWRAPALYSQCRVGRGGCTFRVLKFRSMRLDAELEGAQWAQRQDPRVTRVGAIIRKLRVDELPQVINVLRGHMSFVGPRPERPEFVAQLAEEIPYYVQRHCVKPGITGWAQLCYPYGSSEQDALEKLQYDLYYIKNNSLLFDLAILVQTAEVVLLGKGAR